MKKLINIKPHRATAWLLGAVPILIVIFIYLGVSNARLAENPHDRLFPSVATMSTSFERLATHENVRTGDITLWTDTAASLSRLIYGVGLSALIGLAVGMLCGAIPLAGGLLSPLITVVSLIPPLAILPILFIALGTDELSKVMLIVIGVCPFIIRDLQAHAERMPHEQLIKAQTLGGNSWQIIVRVLLPQLLPRLIQSVRLALGSAWLFLIAAEAIAAQSGLGYRIFLYQRYLAMEIILPYVGWITLLAFLMDRLLVLASRLLFPWYSASGGKS
ncbi:hypothetical protein R84981_002057 [Carnimonas sp. R-84981]|uniref:ABC transporter permease n=1 Tax=Carnimonas bestiolae TaxID=3402172 RepID=UPI003EDBDCDC